MRIFLLLFFLVQLHLGYGQSKFRLTGNVQDKTTGQGVAAQVTFLYGDIVGWALKSENKPDILSFDRAQTVYDWLIFETPWVKSRIIRVEHAVSEMNYVDYNNH